VQRLRLQRLGYVLISNKVPVSIYVKHGRGLSQPPAGRVQRAATLVPLGSRARPQLSRAALRAAVSESARTVRAGRFGAETVQDGSGTGSEMNSSRRSGAAGKGASLPAALLAGRRLQK